MDLENQSRIRELAEKVGRDQLVVVLGAADEVGAETCARTVTSGDPSFAGPLAGVPLELPVYHIFELKDEIPPETYDQHVSMMEMVLEPEKLAQTVSSVRKEGQG